MTEPFNRPDDYVRAIMRMFDLRPQADPSGFVSAFWKRREAYLWDGEDKQALLSIYERLTLPVRQTEAPGVRERSKSKFTISLPRRTRFIISLRFRLLLTFAQRVSYFTPNSANSGIACRASLPGRTFNVFASRTSRASDGRRRPFSR